MLGSALAFSAALALASQGGTSQGAVVAHDIARLVPKAGAPETAAPPPAFLIRKAELSKLVASAKLRTHAEDRARIERISKAKSELEAARSAAELDRVEPEILELALGRKVEGRTLETARNEALARVHEAGKSVDRRRLHAALQGIWRAPTPEGVARLAGVLDGDDAPAPDAKETRVRGEDSDAQVRGSDDGSGWGAPLARTEAEKREGLGALVSVLPRGERDLPTVASLLEKLERVAERIGLDVDRLRELGVEDFRAFLLALIHWESRFKPNAESYAGAQGLMQVMPGTAKEVGVHGPLNNVWNNLKAGIGYINKLLRYRWISSVKLLLAAYNAGPFNKAVRKGRVPVNGQTDKYVPGILKLEKKYQQGLGGTAVA